MEVVILPRASFTEYTHYDITMALTSNGKIRIAGTSDSMVGFES